MTPEARPGVAVLLEGYRPLHERKEGVFVAALREAGIDARLVTRAKPELAGHDPSYPVRAAAAGELRDPAFWSSLPGDAVLVYTFLNPRFTPCLEAIRAGGKLALVRADSDGCIGPPVLSQRLFAPPAGAANRARRAAWRLFPRRMAERRLAHLRAAAAVWIETPQARANLGRFLAWAGAPELLDRVAHVPVIVGRRFREAPLGEKVRQVAAVGRWDDERQKNPRVLMRALLDFLAAHADHRAVVLGPGRERLRAWIGAAAHERLELRGAVEPAEVAACLASSRILLLASRWEGLPLAAAEAACLGCTVCGTPVAGLQYLARDGEGGTLADGFEAEGLAAALKAEARRWEAGRVDSEAIAAFWRARLAPPAVVAGFLELLAAARERA